MKRFVVAVMALIPLLLLPRAAVAQTDPEATLFLGYSYLRTDVGSDAGAAHGIQGEYTYFLERRVGFTVSAGIYWGTLDAPPNIFVVDEYDLQQIVLLAGPTFVVWRSLTSELDVSLSGGAARRSLEASGLDADVSSEWAIAAGANAALDFRISEHIWLRAVEPGVVFTRFDDVWQTDFRVGVGLVLRSREILR